MKVGSALGLEAERGDVLDPSGDTTVGGSELNSTSVSSEDRRFTSFTP